MVIAVSGRWHNAHGIPAVAAATVCTAKSLLFCSVAGVHCSNTLPPVFESVNELSVNRGRVLATLQVNPNEYRKST